MNLPRQFAIATVVVLAAILGTLGHAANVPTLVRDINQMPIGVSSNTTFLGTIGSLTFFTADDGVHGSELWKTDGTTAGTSLVKDINPGSAASNPANFLVVGNVAYFSATTAASGQEVWVTDGTNAGTRLVADIAPGPLSSGAFPAGALGSKVLIYAITNNSPHLYASDGTPSGTVALAATDLYQRATAGLLVTATNGKAYFEATPWERHPAGVPSWAALDLRRPEPTCISSPQPRVLASCFACVWPTTSKDRLHCCTSHMPMMFFSRR